MPKIPIPSFDVGQMDVEGLRSLPKAGPSWITVSAFRPARCQAVEHFVCRQSCGFDLLGQGTGLRVFGDHERPRRLVSGLDQPARCQTL